MSDENINEALIQAITHTTRHTMRMMAWERAKGEVRSLLHGDYSPGIDSSLYKEWNEKFEKRKRLIWYFIRTMEEEHLI